MSCNCFWEVGHKIPVDGFLEDALEGVIILGTKSVHVKQIGNKLENRSEMMAHREEGRRTMSGIRS